MTSMLTLEARFEDKLLHVVPDGDHSGKCWMYQHMPKSGGTTVIRMLKKLGGTDFLCTDVVIGIEETNTFNCTLTILSMLLKMVKRMLLSERILKRLRILALEKCVRGSPFSVTLSPGWFLRIITAK